MNHDSRFTKLQDILSQKYPFTPRAEAALLKLHELYTEQQSQPTPWDEQDHALAYMNYYFPLNFMRLSYLEEKIPYEFWHGVDHVVELGSGAGNSHLALEECLSPEATWTFVELSKTAQKIHQSLSQNTFPRENKLTNDSSSNREKQIFNQSRLSWRSSWSKKDLQHLGQSEHGPSKVNKKIHLGIFSFVLAEMTEPPNWMFDLDRILVVEPGSKIQGRALLELRERLISLGYTILAPCTHQQACPLLHHSQKDWCHQRFPIELTGNLKNISDKIGVENSQLAFSYLVAAKDLKNLTADKARVVGDLLLENGKSRQLICRGINREFLSFLTRHFSTPPRFERGDLIALPTEALTVANEVRPPPGWSPKTLS